MKLKIGVDQGKNLQFIQIYCKKMWGNFQNNNRRQNNFEFTDSSIQFCFLFSNLYNLFICVNYL